MRQILASYEWDVVVLQGHSFEAVDPQRVAAFRSAAARLAALVRERGAQPLLFMTWAYSGQLAMTADLDRVYRSLGNELGIRVVPVGLAFERAEKEIPGVGLRIADGKHPTPAGSYLAACVLYGALYGRSPLPMSYDAGLAPDLARNLRRVAWQTVQDYY